MYKSKTTIVPAIIGPTPITFGMGKDTLLTEKDIFHIWYKDNANYKLFCARMNIDPIESKIRDIEIR